MLAHSKRPESLVGSAKFLIPTFFLISGVSGLVYQVVWMRMLIRVFGVTVYAVSTIIVVFMGGLALGAFLAGRYVKLGRLMRTYALLETGIGAAAILSTLIIGNLAPVFTWGSQTFGTNAMLPFRLLLAIVVLLVPTMLMGATLPVMSGYLTQHEESVGKQAGILYGINTAGAVVGVFLAGFVLIMQFGEVRTVAVAVTGNLVVGALALALSRASNESPNSGRPPPPPDTASTSASISQLRWLYAASGFCALGYEVIWARLLNLVQGNSVYAFSAMLGVYLIGISVGSLLMSRYVDKIRDPLALFGYFEIAIGILAVVSIHFIVFLGLKKTHTLYNYSQLWSIDDFYRLALNAVLIILPVTLALGAIFPLVTHLCRSSGSATSVVGKLYGYNTVGSILGSFVTGFFLIRLFGTLMTLLLLAGVSLLIGAYLVRTKRVVALISLLVFLTVASFSMRDPFLQILMARLPETDELIDHREEEAATVTVVRSGEKRDLYINGLYVSSTDFTGRFMMHMPLLLHPAPKKSLIVGLGAGEAFTTSLEHGLHTTVVDFLPAVVEHYPTFQPEKRTFIDRPEARVVINDGRNFLLGSDEQFDVVLVDGTPPLFASGMVNLYTVEFVRLVHAHLTEQGIFCLWLPLYSFEEDLWMIIRNFTEVFPRVRIWARDGVSGIILLGSPTEDPYFDISAAELDERIETRGFGNERRRIGPAILGGLFRSEARIRARAEQSQLVTDDRPRTEYPLRRFIRGEELVTTPAFLDEVR